jgi:hypothetical protein
MFVMPLKVFMDLNGLLPDHQTMLLRGDLVRHDPETMKDLTMFISHQCKSTACPILLSLEPSLRAVAAVAPQTPWTVVRSVCAQLNPPCVQISYPRSFSI